jgi:hypothetical protein
MFFGFFCLDKAYTLPYDMNISPRAMIVKLFPNIVLNFSSFAAEWVPGRVNGWHTGSPVGLFARQVTSGYPDAAILFIS